MVNAIMVIVLEILIYKILQIMLDGAVSMGASVLSYVFAMLLHGAGFYVLFPKIIHGESTIVRELTNPALYNMNLFMARSVCVAARTLIIFIIFRIISEFVRRDAYGQKPKTIHI